MRSMQMFKESATTFKGNSKVVAQGQKNDEAYWDTPNEQQQWHCSIKHFRKRNMDNDLRVTFFFFSSSAIDRWYWIEVSMLLPSTLSSKHSEEISGNEHPPAHPKTDSLIPTFERWKKAIEKHDIPSL